MTFLKSHLPWLLFIIWHSEPVIPFKKKKKIVFLLVLHCNRKINPYPYLSLLQTLSLNPNLFLSLFSHSDILTLSSFFFFFLPLCSCFLSWYPCLSLELQTRIYISPPDISKGMLYLLKPNLYNRKFYYIL